jgi:hypothetical protein
MVLNLIPMLTHNDMTVKNAQEIFNSCKDIPIKHWGFKDVGLPQDEMKKLVKSMQEAGKTTFLEVVSLSEEECMQGAQMAVECRFNYLMGTVFYNSVFQYLQENKINYFPFCGEVVGHPSILEGTPEEIVEDGYKLQMKGVQGIDLLAYRHATSAEEIATKLVQKLEIPVVVAGSIKTFERIDFMKRIQPWGFTIGSALFERKFMSGGSFRDQLLAAYEYLNKV